jgi:hypothetical protein
MTDQNEPSRQVRVRRLLFVLSRIGTDAEAEAARAYIREAGYGVAPGHVRSPAPSPRGWRSWRR